MNSSYVDDCLLCLLSLEQFLGAISEEERAMDIKDMDLDHGTLPIERVLGVQWCVKSDALKFKISIQDRPLTCRGILSVVSSIYDPLGVLVPVALKAKLILQDLCRKGLGWDDIVPTSMALE